MRCTHISRIGTRCTRIEGHFPNTPHVSGFTS